jgi:hypothetical protein
VTIFYLEFNRRRCTAIGIGQKARNGIARMEILNFAKVELLPISRSSGEPQAQLNRLSGEVAHLYE